MGLFLINVIKTLEKLRLYFFKILSKKKGFIKFDKPFLNFCSIYNKASIASAYTFLGETPTWRPTTSPF